MKTARTLDVSALPEFAFGHRSLMWWGTMGMIVIEGTMFGALLASYFYLRTRSAEWPPALLAPDLRFGTANTLLLVASCWPNHRYKAAAEKQQLGPTRFWLVVSVLCAIGWVVLRVFEFKSLHCRWSDNAYASILWVTLGFHTTHIVTDLLDTLVLTVLMFTRHAKGRRFADVAENGVYWYFVVLIWLPIYATLYLVPR